MRVNTTSFLFLDYWNFTDLENYLEFGALDLYFWIKIKEAAN
jgi:hypothetical protein